MSQNTSSAVMQQRQEARDALDDYPTPSWATRALIERVIVPNFGAVRRSDAVWEPCCNRGYMSRPLSEYFDRVVSTDVHNYGWNGQDGLSDFLIDGLPAGLDQVDWLIFNPPFVLGEQFFARALQYRPRGIAMFVRTSFLEGGGRYDEIFSRTPPTLVAQFAERVVLTKSIVRDPNERYWDAEAGKWRKPSTATSYCWLLWVAGAAPRPFSWIPPSRRQLERPGDYDVPEGCA